MACEIVLCGPRALKEKQILLYTDIEWAFTNWDGQVVKASASGAVDSGQTNDFKIGICTFPA